MPVTYNAATNTITVTGYSSTTPCTFADIYNASVAGGWGVVSRAPISQVLYAYTLSAHLVVGDGTTATYLVAKTVVVVFDGDFDLIINSEGTLTLGELKYNTIPNSWRGATLYWNRRYTRYPQLGVYGVLNLYNSCVFDLTYTWTHPCNFTTYSGGITNIIDSVFGSQSYDKGPHFAWSVNINAGGTLNAWGAYFVQIREIAIRGTVNNYGGFILADVIYGASVRASATIRNVAFYRTTYFDLWSSYRGTVFSVVDCVFDEAKIAFYQSAPGSFPDGPIVLIKNTLSITVIDSAFAPVSGALVSIKDKDGNTVYSGLTNELGAISAEISYKYLQRRQNGWGVPADFVVTYTPHTVTISKSGYKTRTVQYVMSKKREEVEMLELSPPSAPSNLTASAVSRTQINLTWTDNSGGAASFRIERSPNGETLWTHIATAEADATEYSDVGLDCGTTYYYRICAVNEYGNSDYSEVVSATTEKCTVPQVVVELESAIP